MYLLGSLCPFPTLLLKPFLKFTQKSAVSSVGLSLTNTVCAMCSSMFTAKTINSMKQKRASVCHHNVITKLFLNVIHHGTINF